MKINIKLVELVVRVIVPLTLSIIPLSLLARDIKIVEGFSKYVMPKNISIEEAEAVAVQRAIVDALTAEFGTIVQSEVWTEMYNSSENSSEEMWMNGLNLVKGEWIETIGAPKISHTLTPEGLIVEVYVKGKAVAIKSGNVDLLVNLLQLNDFGYINDSKYKSGNKLVIDFKSPVDGYLSIFLADAESNVMQLLPFANEEIAITEIKGGRKYRFFEDNTKVNEEQYSLYTNDNKERNILYIIFSTNSFVKPLTDQIGGLSIIKAKDFRKWLSRLRASDSKLQTIVRPILIYN